MGKILFITDLDNTLIHSKQFYLDDVCVEETPSGHKSFMSLYTYNSLRKLSGVIDIVPVTTRSMEQYLRINLPFNPSTAFATNGYTCFKNNVLHSQLCLNNTTFNYMNDINYLYQFFSSFKDILSVHIVDNRYLYAVCISGDYSLKLADVFRKTVWAEEFSIETSGRKLYFLPYECNKGVVVDTFKDKGYDTIIASGDSTMDIPMLNKVDVAITLCEIADKVNANTVYMCNNKEQFSDFIVDTIYTYV